MSSKYEVRVTSVYPTYINGMVEYRKFIGVIVSGLSKTATARTIVEVTDSESTPFTITPAVGQIWRVRGNTKKVTMLRNGYEQTKIKITPIKLKLVAPSGDAWSTLIDKNVKGVGHATAQNIWNEVVVKRQDNIFMMLKNKNYKYFESLRINNRSLTFEQIDHLICFWKTYAHVDLIEWLIEKQIPADLARKFALHYENNTIKVVEDNPYTLITFDQNFERIDSIARNTFNVKLDDQRRLHAAMENALQQHTASGGHTLATRSDLEYRVKDMLKDSKLVKKAFTESDNGITYKYNTEDSCYHPIGLLTMEMVVAERLVTLSKRKRGLTNSFTQSLSKSEEKLGFKLTHEQKCAVESCFQNSLSIITGGAGVGKTAVSKVIVDTLIDSGEGVILTALSGRAVIRLRDATGRDAITIASLERNTALHNNINEAGELLDSAGNFTLLIDESSMVDLPTLWRLFTYFNEKLSVIFIGDPQQLPPIGAGLVLHTLVDIKELAVSKLVEAQRFGKDTGIAEYSRMIGLGQIPKSLSYKNIIYHKIKGKKQATQQAINIYLESPKESQLLAATNDEINAINSACQKELNPDGNLLHVVFGNTVYSTSFRLNDPIIFTKNLWQHNIQNGKFGKITSVRKAYKIENGKLIATSSCDAETVFGTIEMEDGLKVNITQEIINHFMLSHCISVHKAQGSQFKKVISILNNIYMVDRDWIYTSITRATESVHILDPDSVYTDRIKNTSNAHKRKTYLSKLISNEFRGIYTVLDHI
ncbi:MAG: AAA family ATPase [Methylococcales bacterium]